MFVSNWLIRKSDIKPITLFEISFRNPVTIITDKIIAITPKPIPPIAKNTTGFDVDALLVVDFVIRFANNWFKGTVKSIEIRDKFTE